VREVGGHVSTVRCLWEEQGGLCWYCKKQVPSRDATVDHVTAKARGGTSAWSNVVMACSKCNGKKANRKTHRLKTLARVNAIRAISALEPLTEFFGEEPESGAVRGVVEADHV
jgi:5-methylcytosine-specific restriction endonuclease McrA